MNSGLSVSLDLNRPMEPIDHVEITAKDVATAVSFYDRLSDTEPESLYAPKGDLRPICQGDLYT